MGRNKKELPPCKERRITIRLTEDMYELLLGYAKKAKVTPVEYVRSLILGKVPAPVIEISFDSTELLTELKQLGHIGSNLNQIARYQAIDRITSGQSLIRAGHIQTKSVGKS